MDQTSLAFVARVWLCLLCAAASKQEAQARSNNDVNREREREREILNKNFWIHLATNEAARAPRGTQRAPPPARRAANWRGWARLARLCLLGPAPSLRAETSWEAGRPSAKLSSLGSAKGDHPLHLAFRLAAGLELGVGERELIEFWHEMGWPQAAAS